MIIKYFFLVLMLMFVVSCSNNKGNNESKATVQYYDSNTHTFQFAFDSIDLKKSIVLLPNGDTDMVLVETSGFSFKIKYEDNVPRYFLMNKGISHVRNRTQLNFRESNKGIFLSWDSIGRINSLGYKYLYSTEAGVLTIDTLGAIDKVEKWDNYTNDGWILETNNIRKKNIKIFRIINGDTLK